MKKLSFGYYLFSGETTYYQKEKKKTKNQNRAVKRKFKTEMSEPHLFSPPACTSVSSKQSSLQQEQEKNTQSISCSAP